VLLERLVIIGACDGRAQILELVQAIDVNPQLGRG
jgi:hypothetical protein